MLTSRDQAPPAASDRRRTLISTALGPRAAGRLADTAAVTLRPDLAGSPAGLVEALVTLRPHTLVVGANAVDATVLTRWAMAVRRTHDRRSLLLVRRGTSLAAIDLGVATQLGITVRNTPEVNARHVAQFVIDRLFPAPPTAHAPTGASGTAEAGGAAADGARPILGLVGAGNINGRVARAAVARGHRLVVCAPSLVADRSAAAVWAGRHRLPLDRIQVAARAEEVLEAANAVSVAVPLTSSGRWASVDLLDAARLRTFGGDRLVCVSEPEIWTAQALLDAYDRRDLTVVLDNAPRLLVGVRTLLASRIRADGGVTRPGFTLCSAAMRAPACEADLDQAVLTALGRADLDDLTGAELFPPPAATDAIPTARGATSVATTSVATTGVEGGSPDIGAGADAVDGPRVVVLGGGIVGLTTALLLHAQGHRRILLLDAAPADRADHAEQGTTFGGANARHLSATESLPQADLGRVDVLTRSPAAGGWALRDPATLDAVEVAWARAFADRADQPGLHAATEDLVIALNRLGLRGWSHLFTGVETTWLTGLRQDSRLTRVYLGGADLDAGEQLQRRAGGDVARLSDEVLRRDWPGLGRTIPLPGGPRTVAGAVEVDGYAVNIHDLAGLLLRHLVGLGVEVWADSRVDSLEATGNAVLLRLAAGRLVRAGQVVVTVGGRELVRLCGSDWPGAGAVSQVLGVSLTLPNPGLHRPVKIHAGDPLGVMNVTLCPDGTLIHVSAGFGYLGLAARDAAAAADGLAELQESTLAAVGGLFPDLHRDDVRDIRICARPATPDGLPLVTALPGHDGRVVIAAGTNAGGAVQAPAIAMLAADLLQGTARCAGLAMAGDRIGLPSIREKAPCAAE
ncbi:FAD-dependent oxidoreductase [Frankia sp. AgPm24]|uniref:FAD-dependent oxidoreductase n=1 Tax=Frankia sp. AgPm24 TaxID=631128 RepID=UPI00200F3618|nr:FAD-dependent oxidoreductase [Frankia sp. AgPm24]MCK9924390.1 FAD-dependent oxidoreductase [Frankia sp. AgPm24]